MNLGSDRAQDEDAAELMHDLRTPLAVIKSVITMFARYWDRLDVDKRRDLLQIALHEIATLDRQIGRLADHRQIRLDGDSDRDDR